MNLSFIQHLPSVMVVSVNPMTNVSNNGKTFASIFEGYPKEKLYQLYFHRELPNSSVCLNYLRISDEDIIKYLLRKDRNLYHEVGRSSSEPQIINPSIRRFLASSAALRLLRSLLLNMFFKKHYDHVLKKIRAIKPDVIFFCGGNAFYLYSLVERICRELSIKLIVYITDDYILPNNSLNIFKKCDRYLTRKSTLAICRNTSLIFTIGDEMQKTYLEKYKLESSVLMNLVQFEREARPNDNFKHSGILKLTYAGGLHLNRWQVLQAISQSLERFCKTTGRSAIIDVYSATPLSLKKRASLELSGYLRIHNPVDSNELMSIYGESDVLLHVESFRKRDRDITKLSVSTKIPEYLSANKSILAVGPSDVASIRYLRAHNAAFICDNLSPKVLNRALAEFFSDIDLRQSLAKSARELFEKRHNAQVIRLDAWKKMYELSET